MTQKYPSLSERIQSSFIDLIIIVILMFVFASVLDRMENPSDWIRIVMFISVWIIYEPLCTSIGGTAGNYIKGIRVRQNADISKRINILHAIVRYAFKFLLGWISFLTINTNPKRGAIHDMVAGSVMIKL